MSAAPYCTLVARTKIISLSHRRLRANPSMPRPASLTAPFRTMLTTVRPTTPGCHPSPSNVTARRPGVHPGPSTLGHGARPQPVQLHLQLHRRPRPVSYTHLRAHETAS